MTGWQWLMNGFNMKWNCTFEQGPFGFGVRYRGAYKEINKLWTNDYNLIEELANELEEWFQQVDRELVYAKSPYDLL
jgi:hypothetical protein